jgi:hypothetical protein
MKNIILIAFAAFGINALKAQTVTPSQERQRPAKSATHSNQDSTYKSASKPIHMNPKTKGDSTTHMHAIPEASPTNSNKKGYATKPGVNKTDTLKVE